MRTWPVISRAFVKNFLMLAMLFGGVCWSPQAPWVSSSFFAHSCPSGPSEHRDRGGDPRKKIPEAGGVRLLGDRG